MKQFILFFTVGVFFMTLLWGCLKTPPGNYFYVIENNADYPVYVQESPFFDEDSSFRCRLLPHYVRPHSRETIERRDAYEKYFSVLNQGGTEYLKFIVIDTTTCNDLWGSEERCLRMREDAKVLKRYYWKLEDFEANDWTLVYPD